VVQKLPKSTKFCPYLSFWGKSVINFKKISLGQAWNSCYHQGWVVTWFGQLEPGWFWLPRTGRKSGLIFGAEMRTRFQKGWFWNQNWNPNSTVESKLGLIS